MIQPAPPAPHPRPVAQTLEALRAKQDELLIYQDEHTAILIQLAALDAKRHALGDAILDTKREIEQIEAELLDSIKLERVAKRERLIEAA